MLETVLYKGLIGFIAGLMVCAIVGIIELRGQKGQPKPERPKFKWRKLGFKIPLPQEFRSRLAETLRFYRHHCIPLAIFFVGIFLYTIVTQSNHYGASYRPFTDATGRLFLLCVALIIARWLYAYRPAPLIAFAAYLLYLPFLSLFEEGNDILTDTEGGEVLLGLLAAPFLAQLIFRSKNKNRKQIAVFGASAWFLMVVANLNFQSAIMLVGVPCFMVAAIVSYKAGKEQTK